MGLFAGLPADPKQCALEYARRGIPVFPCAHTKQPLIKTGFKAATTDPIQINKWFSSWPRALIGIPTGPASGYMVHDLDAKSCDVEMALAELEADYGPIIGPLVRTMSGGFHVWTRWVDGIRNSASKLRPGYDVRGEGGYAIAPGSMGYQLIRDVEPGEPPAGLIAALRSLAGKPALAVVGGTQSGLVLSVPQTLEQQIESAMTEGSRHDATVRLVWSLVKRGMSLDEVMAFAPFLGRSNGWSMEEAQNEVYKAAKSAFEKQGLAATGKAEPQPIQIYSLQQLQSRDPPDWQIDGAVPEGGLSVLFGDSATFKTFVTLDMALSIAYGVPWQGRAVKQGPVIYVLGEGQGGFANRVQAWREAHGLADVDAPFFTILQPVPFGDFKAVALLVKAIEATGVKPVLVIIDTLARNFGGGDPDKTQDMTTFVTGLDAVRHQFSTGVFVVHHSGKDSAKGARNSSVLRAAVDCEIRAEREEGAQRVKLTNTKQKEGEEFRPLWVSVEPIEIIDGRTGEVVKSLAVKSDSATNAGVEMKSSRIGKVEKWIIETLADAGTLTMPELVSRGSDHNRQNLYRTVNTLTEKGIVCRDDGPPVVIWLADQYQHDEG